MGVDDAGHNYALTRIEVGIHIPGCNPVDASPYYMYGRGTNSLGRDYTPAANYRQAVSAQKRRRRFIDT